MMKTPPELGQANATHKTCMLELKLSLFLSVALRRAIVSKTNCILLLIKLLGSLGGMDSCEEMHIWEEKSTFPQAIRDGNTLLIIIAFIQAWNTVGFLPLFKGVNNNRVSNIMKSQIMSREKLEQRKCLIYQILLHPVRLVWIKPILSA